MITIFNIVFAVSAALIALCMVRFRNVKKNYIPPLYVCFSGILVSVLCHLVIINSENIRALLFFYSVFFVAIDVILLCLLDFVRKYTKQDEYFPKLNLVLTIFAALDSVSLMLNNFVQYSFTVVPVSHYFSPLGQTATIYKIHYAFPYTIHLILCYIIVAFAVLFLVAKIFRSPKMYKFIYTNIFLALAINIIGDAVYVFTNYPINIAIVFYALGTMLLAFYAVHFTPSQLIHRQLHAVVSTMNDAVILFDINGEVFYKNAALQRLIDRYSALGLTPTAPFAELKNNHTFLKIKNSPDRDFDEEICHNDRVYTFHVSIKHMTDDHNNFLGLFFIIHDKTEEMDKLNKERYLAIHDPLTDLYNRTGFYEKVRSVLTIAPDEKYLMVCADVDNFKMINDLFGRETGDAFLIRAADAIRKYTKENEVAARLSGDHFALLMKKSDYNEQVFIDYPSQIAYLNEDTNYPVVFHIGVYEIDDISTPVSVMCDRAFMAAKPIKGNVKQTLAYYSASLRKAIINEQKMIGDFPEAINSEQFKMYLQPQVSVKGGVFGAEALVRWQHPKEGLIPPQKFIPIFEQKGLIANLDMYIWDLAAQKLREWKNAGINMYISVNISPRDFIYIDIYKTFTQLIKKYGIDPKQLKLEITESAILSNVETQIALIKKLREAGFEIEMDDFGSGYSSLNLLKDIPFDVLKIDMEFLRVKENKQRSLQILSSIISLSKDLNMPVITEGVETKEQVKFLEQMGTDYFQGFYFAKPMPVSEFEQKYL